MTWNPKIYHCVELHGEPDARKQRAHQSWDNLYELGRLEPVMTFHETIKRSARDIGDSLDLPFFKDVLQVGLDKAGDDDIVLFTNNDIILHPHLPDALKLHLGLWEACSGRRCEFKTHAFPGLMASNDEWASKSDPHCGRDLFAATKRWWLKHWGEIGDFILGAPVFDLNLAAIIRLSKSHHLTRQNLDQNVPCCELAMGYLGHEHHSSPWAQRPKDTPSHVHNGRLFREWAAVNLPELRFYGDQI
jgi:hypothetical protein